MSELKPCPWNVETDVYKNREGYQKISNIKELRERLKCVIEFLENCEYADEIEFQRVTPWTYESGKLMGRKEFARDILILIKYGEYPE